MSDTDGLSLHGLDRRGFLGYRAWDFSVRSLGQQYGRAFLRRVVLRHPLRALQGWREYRRLMGHGRHDNGVFHLFSGSEDELIGQAALQEPGRFLVALGFCQKKMASADDPAECPAGRFNHDCLYVERWSPGPGIADSDLPSEIDAAPGMKPGLPWGGPVACGRCDVRVFAQRALCAGASLYLMTAAQEIALDIMLPSLEQERFRQTLMCLCPMSVQAIVLPLLICGLQGFLVSFDSGYCGDYEEWLRADRGDKPKQTGLDLSCLRRSLEILGRLAEARRALGFLPAPGWRRQGNVYLPHAAKL